MTTTMGTTGTKQVIDATTYVVFTRTFHASIDDVWAAVTESERLARWIGHWKGDPSSGKVTFQMLFEGDEIPAEEFAIELCDPPHQLLITTTSPTPDGGTQSWRIRIGLAEHGGITTLTFAQDAQEMAEGVGPGWHYYLDRMVVAETGGDVAAVDFADYHPALAPHYRGAFG